MSAAESHDLVIGIQDHVPPSVQAGGMKAPVRVQLRRTKGWRLPPNTVSVARPGFWGNPHRVVLDEVRHTGEWDQAGEPIMGAGPWLCQLQPDRIAGMWFATKVEAIQRAVDLYRLRIERLELGQQLRDRLPDLRGKSLACWCPLDQPCHADVLLELANAEPALSLSSAGRAG